MLRLVKSFGYAGQGIVYVARTQLNMQIHLSVMSAVIGVGFYFKITTIEWLILILCFMAVLTLECINTGVEALTDLVAPQYHPLAKVAKDTCAGAVLIAALGSALIGLIIFFPYFVKLF